MQRRYTRTCSDRNPAKHCTREFQILKILTPFAAPCELPPIQHGQYLSGYRAGLTIANGSYVNYQCDHEFVKITTVPTECFRGDLLPKKPACRRGKCVNFTNTIHLKPQPQPQNNNTAYMVTKFSPSTSPNSEIQGLIKTSYAPHAKLSQIADPNLYTAGSDIMRSTELGSMDLLSGLRGSCGPPARIQGSLVFRNGEPLSDTERR